MLLTHKQPSGIGMDHHFLIFIFSFHCFNNRDTNREDDLQQGAPGRCNKSALVLCTLPSELPGHPPIVLNYKKNQIYYATIAFCFFKKMLSLAPFRTDW